MTCILLFSCKVFTTCPKSYIHSTLSSFCQGTRTVSDKYDIRCAHIAWVWYKCTLYFGKVLEYVFLKENISFIIDTYLQVSWICNSYIRMIYHWKSMYFWNCSGCCKPWWNGIYRWNLHWLCLFCRRWTVFNRVHGPYTWNWT